jgi:ABC-type multidrug transport system ATPase subunit
MSPIIEVRGLTKSFNEITAVDNLSFTVNAREVYGFLGENGAGKSTTIRMLLSLIQPTAGEIKLFGQSLSFHRNEVLRKTGAIIEKPDLYKYLTGIENLRFFGLMSGLKLNTKQLLDRLEKVGLAERAYSKVKTYSQGMKQRLGIAVALVHDPELIILDEPLNGLDPQGMADIRQLIHHMSKDLGKTVFISSHLLSEMELVADSLLIIHQGKKIAEGKMNELLNPETVNVEIECNAAVQLKEKLSGTPWMDKAKQTGTDKVIIHMQKKDIPGVIKMLAASEVNIYSVKTKHSLEDYFLALTAD